MDFRNYLYDHEILKVYRSKIPVVSVGNLTLGGTGKTPILIELLSWALRLGLRPAVISRGYKGTFKNFAKIPRDPDPEVYGDEPSMISKKFPNVPIYVGGDRVALLNEVIKKENVNIVFADDAFQHRRMHRVIDIVIIDCTEKIDNYRVVPTGRGREFQAGLKRADFIILNKVNLASPSDKNNIINFIEEVCGDKDIPIIESEYYISQYISLDEQRQFQPTEYEKVLLVSGVGNPHSVSGLVNKSLSVGRHLAYDDHHKFTLEDVNHILKIFKGANFKKIIITEKDAIKLQKFEELHEFVWVAHLTPKMSIRAKSLYERIASLV